MVAQYTAAAATPWRKRKEVEKTNKERNEWVSGDVTCLVVVERMEVVKR